MPTPNRLDTPRDQPAGLKVLVVEDDGDSAHTLAALVRLYGHQAEVVLDGPSALVKAADWSPDAVLLDIGLPGMSGLEVARRLQREGPGKTPLLVAITGRDRDVDRQRSEEVGIHLHLAKPADPKVLEVLLRRLHAIIVPG